MPDNQFADPKVPKHIKVQVAKDPPKEILEQTFTADPSLFSGDPVETKVDMKDDKIVPFNSQPDNKSKPDEQKIDKTTPNNDGSVASGQPDPAAPKDEKQTATSILKPPATTTEKKDAAKGEVKLPEGKQVVLPSKDKVVRDYSGFSADEVTVLKQMSDSAYKYATDLIKTNKELAKNKDTTYLQHPDAYTLSPEYRQVQNDIYFAQTEAKAWSDALSLIKQAKPFKPLTGFDQQGNPTFGPEMQPTDTIEEEVRQLVINARGMVQSNTAKLQEKASTFKNRTSQDLQLLENERKIRFPWVADPKMMDYTLDIDGTEMSIKDAKQAFHNIFPDYMRNHPAINVASDLFIALRISNAETQQALAGKQTAEIQKDEIQRAEPSSDARQDDTKEVHGVKTFSMNGMPN